MKTRHLRLLSVVTGSVRDAALFVQPAGGNSTAHHGGGHGGGLHISPAALGLTATQYAFLLGTLSGASLPFGALLGLRIRPNDATCSGWIAVGAGALLFAVSVELYAHAIHDYTSGRMDPSAMVVLMMVSVFGSIFFTWTTRVLEGVDEEEFEAVEEACPSCGQQAPCGASFCYKCGQLLPVFVDRVPLSLCRPQSAGETFRRLWSGFPEGSDGSASDCASRASSAAPPFPSRRRSNPAAHPSGAWATRVRSPRGPSPARSQQSGGAQPALPDLGSARELQQALTGRTSEPVPQLQWRRVSSPAGGARSLRTGPLRVGAMLRAAQAQDRRRARRRWKRLRQAVVMMQVVRYLQQRAATTRRLLRANDGSEPSISPRVRPSPRSPRSPPERPRSSAEGSWMGWARRNTGALGDSTNSFFEKFKLAVSSAGENDADYYSAEELEEMQQHRVGALKMYAVLLVDGIPEGILMGFLAAEGFLSTTLVLSFFIANFPEAFAGGVLMQRGGFHRWQIVGLWGGLMLIIGLLAGVSCHLLLMVDPEFSGETHTPFEIQILVSVIEGLAGGAMISGIAGTMLPEAYERRNKTGWMISSGGFLCTIGFLTSVGIKIAFN